LAWSERFKHAYHVRREIYVVYLDCKKGLKWILGVIRSSRVRGELLIGVFRELESYGDKGLWEKALEACRKMGFL